MRNSRKTAADRGAQLRFGAMRDGDLEEVVRIEAASFSNPWKRHHFLHEMRSNRWALNRVLRRGDRVVGYASVWVVDAELQVNKIAVDPRERGAGLGRKLLERLVLLADRTRCRAVTLEVRANNLAARMMYERFGFVEIGRREAYYGPDEPAIVMRLERGSHA